MRRSLATALGALGLCMLVAAPAPAQDAARLDPVSSVKFPERAYRLTVPERRALTPDQVRVAENGEGVGRFSLTAAGGQQANDFATVLVIDASKSMRGAAIRRAVEAARLLAAQRAGRQQIGVVVFNRSPRVILDLTDDQSAIETALSAPPLLAAQTHIFDAVDVAVKMLREAQIVSGSVVVLSDGSDTGSRVSAATVAGRARRGDVRIFSVGLRSGAFDPGELRALATDSAAGGSYANAESVTDLRGIFGQLGQQLASQYLIRYRSLGQPGREVHVAVRVAGIGGLATSAYEVPGDATFVLIEDGFWTSTLGILVTAGLCALLLAIALSILLLRRHRRPGLRERIRAFVSTPGSATTAADERPAQDARGSAERSLERTSWWPDFKEDVEIARIGIAPIRLVGFTAGAAVVVAYLTAAIVGSWLLAVPAALATVYVARTYLRVMLSRQRQEFATQLPDMLQGSASAIRAGHGLVGAIALVTEDAPEPSRAEFRRVIADEQLGVPLDEALRVVERRMESSDVRQIALVAEIQRETGGNMAEVLDRVTEALRQRAELRRMVQGLTAQGRLTRGVLTILPILLLASMSVISPAYVDPLYNTTLGLVLLGFAAVLVTAGSLVIKKIVDFKV